MNNLDGILSLLIACIEIVLLINLLIFTDKNKENNLIYIIITLLAVYQLFEFLMCSLGMKSSAMAYLAFIDISFLPPLNFIFVFSFLKIESSIKNLIFLPALFFVVYYSFIIEKFSVVKCTVLYATYSYPLGTLYGLFYYLPLFITFVLMYRKFRSKEVQTGNPLKILIIGHYFIIIPVVASFILFLLNLPGLVNSIESILCKFAFGYAISSSFFALNNKSKL